MNILQLNLIVSEYAYGDNKCGVNSRVERKEETVWRSVLKLKSSWIHAAFQYISLLSVYEVRNDKSESGELRARMS